MHRFAPFTLEHLKNTQQLIKNKIYTKVAPLTIRAWCSKEPLPFEERQTGKVKNFEIGDSWGDLFDCAWFNFTGQVPESCAGKHVVLVIDVNGELCVFDETGTPVRGLTSVNCIWATENGTPVKRILQVTKNAKGGEQIDIWADGGANDLFGTIHENASIREAHIAVCNDEIRTLFFDYEVLFDLMQVLPKTSVRYNQILNALNDVAVLLRDFDKNITKASGILKPLLAEKNGDSTLKITAIGHSHMDLAWLWPIRETIRKSARTFATTIELMDRYPDYIYCASQPQMYQWMKDIYPGLYAKIKQKVKECRINPAGAMWVESDSNVPSGESLVRQLILGKQFWLEEFGLEINNLFLPDVFGYSATLPQLLKKADVDYFTTQKLSWNLINKFPHHSFHWQGIDGTKVLAHMLPEETYNSASAPHSVKKVEENFKNKDTSEHALLLYGIGDGGGGPSAEHLERLDRMKDLSGLSPVKQEKVEAFFAHITPEADKFPVWVGELYLERHQGTLTTHARNKWFNRKGEIALKNLEMISIFNHTMWNEKYPADMLLSTWREFLLYQFHDILPGSSIKRVYDECVPRYESLYGDTKKLMAAGFEKLALNINTSELKNPLVVFNTLNWERTEWLKAGETWQKIQTPSVGYTTIEPNESKASFAVSASDSALENDIFKLELNQDGFITSIWDKESSRELIPKGALANQLAVYYDEGDAWDMPLDYAETTPQLMKLESRDFSVDGPKTIITQKFSLDHSTIEQKIILTQGSRRIDFETTGTWREIKSMLRTSFPVNIHADFATYEIQFGHITRPTHDNTNWDLAKQENPTQKWADLSEANYGVALLNDSKYAYKIKQNVIDLDLLRSAPYPGPVLVKNEDVNPGEPHGGYTDQCDHQFTYSLFPHKGDFVKGGVVQAAFELNNPLYQINANSQAGELEMEKSFIKIDQDNIFIEAIKKAEDSDDLVIRLYEASRSFTKSRLELGLDIQKACEVNLLERHPQELKVAGNTVELEFKPFEVKTVKIQF